VAARGASGDDQLGRRVTPDTNRQQQLPQASIRAAGRAGERATMTAFGSGTQWPPAPITGAKAGARTPEQQSADLVAAHEFHRITQFAAACRRQWPNAKITLRPDHYGPSTGADAPPN